MAIDLTRSAITVALGTWAVDPTTSFQAGQPVMLSSAGLVQVSDKTSVHGIAKWNKATALTGAVVAEAVVTGATSAACNLNHANLVGSSTRVVDADGATVPTSAYTVSTTNGTITPVVSAHIAPNATVFVDYSYTLTDYEKDVVRGANWMNLQDDTSGNGKMTVIQDFGIVYTDQFDTSVGYTIGASVYINSAGKFTSTSSTNLAYGKCVSAPTASDPFLGVQIGA